MTTARSDTLIGDDIVHTLGRHAHSSQVLARVRDGHVTLSGDVPSHEAKRQVEQLIAAVDSVRSVDNRLNVDPGRKSFGIAGNAVRDNPGGNDDARMGDIDMGNDG